MLVHASKSGRAILGPHRSGRSGLEYRLRDSSHLRQQVLNLLEELCDLLRDAVAIIKGDKVPWDELLSDSDELNEIIPSINSRTVLARDDGDPAIEVAQAEIDVLDVVKSNLRQLSLYATQKDNNSQYPKVLVTINN